MVQEFPYPRWTDDGSKLMMDCPSCGHRPRPFPRQQVIAAVLALNPDEPRRRVLDYPV
ncbi:hypothetical protein [Frankia gtarii]|uniref:hypothetical protein n=1 Tax=Frankia gtarii TaxID=2950102 RepID=UPI0021C22A0C|nr:hypothetical protein [Frankia gtarii]